MECNKINLINIAIVLIDYNNINKKKKHNEINMMYSYNNLFKTKKLTDINKKKKTQIR